MSTSRRKSQVYKLGIRVAVYTSLFSAIFTFLLLWQYYDLALESVATVSALILLGTFFTSYLVSFILQFRRIQVLEQVSKNISKKRFEVIEDLRTNYEDELDYIIKHLIKSY